MSSHWGKLRVCSCVHFSWKFGSFRPLRPNVRQWSGHELSLSLQFFWYSVFKYFLTSRRDLLISSAKLFSRPIWPSSSTIRCRRSNAADPSAVVLSKPLKDFCCEASRTSRTRNRLARLRGSYYSSSQNFRYCLIIVALTTLRMMFGIVSFSPLLSFSFLVPNATSW